MTTLRIPGITRQEQFLRQLNQASRQMTPVGPPRPLTLADVQRANIDVSAQRALLAMSQSPALRQAAVGLAQAVQGGRLGGIYRQDQLVPAQRARQLGLNWWQMIPPGQDFILLPDPQQLRTGPPVVALTNTVAQVLDRLSRALADAWSAFEEWRKRRNIQSCEDPLAPPFPGVCPLGSVVRSPLADEFIAAHRSRWCLPGERQYKNCENLRERCVRRIVIHALAMADPSPGQTAAENIIHTQWKNTQGDESAHYVIHRDGRITQMVEEHAVAFHVGRPANADSIGIEHSDLCNQPDSFTDRLYRRSAALVSDIAARHGLPLNASNFDQIVIGHCRLGGHTDPGPFWDWEYYKALVLSPGSNPIRLVGSAAEAVSLRAGAEASHGLPGGWSRQMTSRPVHFDEKIKQWGPDCSPNRKLSWGSLITVSPDGRRLLDHSRGTHWTAPPSISGLPAEFRFLVRVPGVYKVSLWWPETSNANSAAPVEIEAFPCLLLRPVPACAAVTRQSTTVDQSARAGEWVDIGTPFAIPPSATSSLVVVRIRPQSTRRGTIVADAVRLLKIG